MTSDKFVGTRIEMAILIFKLNMEKEEVFSQINIIQAQETFQIQQQYAFKGNFKATSLIKLCKVSGLFLLLVL